MSKMKIWFSAAVLFIMMVIYSIGASPTALAEHDHGSGTMAAADNTMGVQAVSGISLIIVILSTLLLTVRIRASSAYLPKMTGMMAAMAISMMGGLVVGTILGIWLQSLFFSTAIGVITGITVGYFAGESHSWLAAMDGMLSGIMGGMMGAMLGVMEIGEHPVLTVLFMDVIMLLMMSFLYNSMKKEARIAVDGTEQTKAIQL